MASTCSCQYCMNNEYRVDMSFLRKKRKRGVSGILRVKNDAEFVGAAIDSCIDALDELIIVYNDCTDDSPKIIKEKYAQYKDKIRYYKYEPPIYANNLSENEYEFIKSQPTDSPHLLSSYYNFALSKVSYEFALKIDADQIYFTDSLQELCDVYRSNKKCFINPVELFCFIYFYVGLILYKKLAINVLFNKRNVFACYKTCLLKLIQNFKIPVFLSGFNVFYYKRQWYSTLGERIEGNINILSPFNGVTDHTLFRVSPKTYFVPIEMEHYSKLNSHKHSVIEVFKGVRIAFPFGFIWIHLNPMRKNIYEKQVSNFLNHRQRFMSFNVFMRENGFNFIKCTNDCLILSQQLRRMYALLYDTKRNIESIIQFVSKYVLVVHDNDFFVRCRTVI